MARYRRRYDPYYDCCRERPRSRRQDYRRDEYSTRPEPIRDIFGRIYSPLHDLNPWIALNPWHDLFFWG